MKALWKSVAVLILAWGGAAAWGADVETPEKVREALEDRRYDEAVKAIDEALAAGAKQPDYLEYLKGRALYLGGKHKEAVDALAAMEKKRPDSAWVRRARFAQAAALVKLRNLEAAEKIFEQEARYLLSTERKHELASIYLEFADAYFQPDAKDTHKKPDFTKALNYYRQALTVGPKAEKRIEAEFRIARSLEELGQHEPAAAAYTAFLKDHPQTPFDVEARFRLGKVQLALGRGADARRTWQDLLDRYAANPPAAAKERLAEAAYRLAHTYGLPQPPSKEDLELATSAVARFIAAYPDHPLAPQAALEAAQGYIAHNRLEEAAAALKKLVAEPKYAKAEALPEARQLLGSVYYRQKKFDTAVAAWQEYLAKHPAHKAWSQVQQSIIDAEFAAGFEAREARKFDLARKLWDAFLAKYPLSDRSALILLQFGLMHYDEEKYEDAIADWKRLVSKYPDRDESSRAQFLIGLVLEQQLGKYPEALEAYKALNWGSYVARAQERTSRLARQELAIVTPRVFRTGQKPVVKVTSRNVKQLTVKAYQIDLETYFRKMHLARGVESLNIALIDPDKSWTFDVPNYADHKQITSDLEIPLALPGVMAVTVSNEPKPNATGEKPVEGLVLRPQEATTMVVVSDLDILVKCSRNELFVYAQNMRTGRPQAGAKLLVSDGSKVFAEGLTNADGVFTAAVREQIGTADAAKPDAVDADDPYAPLKISQDIRVFAMLETVKPKDPNQKAAEKKAADEKDADKKDADEKDAREKKDADDKKAPAKPLAAAAPVHVASSVVGLSGLEFAQGIAPKGFLYTDRPAYRAGHTVQVRGIVRWTKGDQYVFEKGKKFKLEVYDGRNRQIRSDEVTLGDFGTFAVGFQLPPQSPQGEYRLHLFDPAAPEVHTYQGTFLVHEYQLEPIQISIETPRKVYFRGEQATGTIRLRYYYGLPLAGREIRYTLPDGSVQTARTDAAGTVEFKLDTRPFREDQTLSIVANYPERNLETRVNLFLATRAFSATVETTRDVYISGETFDVSVTTIDPAGEKTGQKLTLSIIEQTTQAGQTGERLVEELPLATDEKTGKGAKTIKIEKPGDYILRVQGTDRFGNLVTAERAVTASGDEDLVRLRILADRHHFKAGEKAAVQVHWRDAPALGLVTYQGARVLGYRLVELKQGMNPLVIPLEERLAPNFDLTVCVMSDTGGERRPAVVGKPEIKVKADDKPLALPSFHEASSPIDVERPLTLVIKSNKNPAAPGDEVEVSVTATDPEGKPVAAELSLALVEPNLLARFPDNLPAIAEFFQAARRQCALRTTASCTFRYAPRTRAISDTLLAEAERVALAALEAESRERNGRNMPDDAALPVELGAALAEWEELNDSDDGYQTVDFQNLSLEISQTQSFASDLDIPFKDNTNGTVYAPNGSRLMFGVGVGDRSGGGVQGGGQQSLLSGGEVQAIREQRQRTHSAALLGGGAVNGTTSLQMMNTPRIILQEETFALMAGGGDDKQSNRGKDGLPNFASFETGYWNPKIVTDKDGKATIKFTVPQRSTAWRLTARGVTTGTLSGQATADLVTKKELFGELSLPLAFVDGDAVKLVATVHNDLLAAGKIEVTLRSLIAGKALSETKTIDVQAKGLHEVSFDRQIAGTGEAEFELTVKTGAKSDTFKRSIPVRPDGIAVYASTGGTANANMTAWISPPTGMEVREPSLAIVVGPSVQRSLLDVVLGSGRAEALYHDRLLICGSGLERTTSDLLATLGLLKLLETSNQKGTPEATALIDRARSSIGFLVSSQNDDGGWTWSGAKGASDRDSSARALWSLSAARKAGFAVPDEAHAKAVQYIQTAFTAAREADYRGKSVLLFALTASGREDFAYANRLYRARATLDAEALAYLALVFVEMDRQEFAREMLDLLAAKLSKTPAKPEDAKAASGEFAGIGLPTSGETEIRALYLLALGRLAPRDAKVRETADWLMQHRTASRWQPERATGPAVLALADFFAAAQFAAERYKLAVFVNDEKVADLELDPAAGSHTVEVPRGLLTRGEKLPGAGDPRRQRIQFELTGRGQFTYQCVLSGFVASDGVKSTTNIWQVNRYYQPAPLELDGREIPRGFDVLEGSYTTWRNPVTELPIGRRLGVQLYVSRNNAVRLADDQLDYLVLTEPLPSGTQVLEGSIQGAFERYEIGPGHITFYIGNRRNPGAISFDLYGYTAGKYRAAPTIVRSYYDPKQMVATAVRPLTVLPAGEKSKDEYQLTPRELYELGKRALEKKDFVAAGAHLTALFDKFQLRAEIYKETARMLLDVSLEQAQPAQIVRYFELLKEKYPEMEIEFEQIVKVGAAYRAMSEYERAYLVFRATAEASFQRESQVAGFLDAQGEFERSVAVMDRILREYPAEPYIAEATYALAQQIYAKAPNAAADPALRAKGLTRIDLVRDAIRRLDDFLTVWPDDPSADEASFSLAGGLVELESWKEALARSRQFAKRYPQSGYLDSYWYVMGFSHFALGQHAEALEMCKKVAEATRKDPGTGREVESKNKWRAVYIMGQVHHALGQAAEAILHYSKVVERFADAQEAIEYFNRKQIELAEVTTIKPNEPAQVELKFRNVPEVEVKVYRIDLMKFSLLERDLSGITKINLSGIRPLFESKIALGDGKDYRDRTKKLDLPLAQEGAYLIVCRGDNLHTSGLALVSPLVVEVQEEATSGRVRATVKNTQTDKYAAAVEVKVIGSANDKFHDGRTDLRGVFVADGILGRSTVIARAGDRQYAFHRGTQPLGPPPAPNAAPAQQPANPAAAEPQSGKQQMELLDDLRNQNEAIQLDNGRKLQQLYQNPTRGVKTKAAF